VSFPRKIKYVAEEYTPLSGKDLVLEFCSISTELFSEGEEVEP